jgi:ribonuclease R
MACRQKAREGQNQKGKRSLNQRHSKRNKNRNNNNNRNDGGLNPPGEGGERPPGLPSKEELQKFLQDSDGPQHKRDIAHFFGLKGQEKTQLRRLLRELAEEGGIERGGTRSFKAPGSLPDRALIEIIGLDGDGELRAKPVEWHGKGPVPIIYVIDKRRAEGYAQPGDRILAQLKRIDKLEYEAKILKAIDAEESTRVIGTFQPYKGGGYVYPTDKKNREEYFIPEEYIVGCEEGDLVIAEPLPPSSKLPRAKNPARIVERLGKKNDPKLISLISIHSHGIPTEFPKKALEEAAQLHEPDLSGGREDLRHIPLVTIDGADARDFDDAVYAEPDPDNPGGWHLMVAIADVSYYVRSGSALDDEAFKRGNSTYFADRVVPMLPERLSNDLCSLRPHVNRACLAVHLWIDGNAKLLKYRFTRGLMRSAARLTYEQVEEAHMGAPGELAAPLMETVIKPLYKAYAVLKRARELRGALEIDLPERKAIIKDGKVMDIVPRQRLASHQLIEEFMILANVAAAIGLEDKNAVCVYRVHDRPAFDRLEATREFLKEFGYSLPKGEHLKPANINHILKTSADNEDKELIHTVLLRTQSQAVYSPDNLGHFGLALEKYAHFTSPIRRYADLLVHRALTRAYGFGEGGMTDDEANDLHNACEHISFTERRSMVAERDVMDRFTAQYLSTNLGKEFPGRVSGVTRFGLFVTLEHSGADGIVPIRSLPRDFYIHDEKRHALVGKDTGRMYRLADKVVVRLVEADSMRGSTVFELLEGTEGGAEPRYGERPRSQGGRHDRQHSRDKRRRDNFRGGKRGGGKKPRR